MKKLRKTVNSLLKAFFLLAVTGCVTTGDLPSVPLQASLSPQFSKCGSSDGLLFVRIFKDGDLQASGELEWVAGSASNWKMDLVTPMGQTLVRVSRRQNQVSSIGSLKAQIPPIKVLENGFLEVDGNLLAIRPDEIPCLLDNKLPRSWVPDLYKATNNSSEQTLLFADEVRTIKLTFDTGENSAEKPRCALISWSHYWGLVNSELRWCQQKEETSLEGVGDLKMTWVKLDE